MHTAALVRPSSQSRLTRLIWLPAIALLIAGLLAAMGYRLNPSANAATDSVTVTASVGSQMNVSDGCGGVDAIAVNIGAIAYSTGCVMTFGSTNDATTRLQIQDNDGGLPEFFRCGAGLCAGTQIANTAASCAAFAAAGDEAGVKVTAVNAGTAVNATWGGAACSSAAGTNDDWKAMPATYAAGGDLCDTSTIGSGHTCTVQWGVFERGAAALPGNFVGVAAFNTFDF